MLPKKVDGTYRSTISTVPGVTKRGAWLTESLVRSLASDPKWHEKVASFRDATLPYRYYASLAKVSQSPVNWVWTYCLGTPNKKSVRATLDGYPLIQGLYAYRLQAPAFGERAVLDSACKLDFLAKVRETESPFQSIPFFGELKETIDMVRHPLKGILKHTRKYARSVSNLRRLPGLVQKSDRFAEILNSAYLQWTYGVAPLFGDIESIKQAVENLMEKPEVTRISVSKKGETNAKCLYNATTTEYSGNLVFQQIGMARSLYNVRISGALRAEFTGPKIEHMLQQVSFNLRDFVPSMYELLPHSFLVDYFSTTGKVLGGLFTSTKNLIYASKSTKLTTELVGLGFPLPSLSSTCGSQVSGSLARVNFEMVDFNRSKADLSVSFKDWRFVHPTAGQWFNTAALGVSQLRANSRI
jgi:hypothetical protein